MQTRDTGAWIQLGPCSHICMQLTSIGDLHVMHCTFWKPHGWELYRLVDCSQDVVDKRTTAGEGGTESQIRRLLHDENGKGGGTDKLAQLGMEGAAIRQPPPHLLLSFLCLLLDLSLCFLLDLRLDLLCLEALRLCHNMPGRRKSMGCPGEG